MIESNNIFCPRCKRPFDEHQVMGQTQTEVIFLCS